VIPLKKIAVIMYVATGYCSFIAVIRLWLFSSGFAVAEWLERKCGGNVLQFCECMISSPASGKLEILASCTVQKKIPVHFYALNTKKLSYLRYALFMPKYKKIAVRWQQI
jgi:hypothetical protein